LDDAGIHRREDLALPGARPDADLSPSPGRRSAERGEAPARGGRAPRPLRRDRRREIGVRAAARGGSARRGDTPLFYQCSVTEVLIRGTLPFFLQSSPDTALLRKRGVSPLSTLRLRNASTTQGRARRPEVAPSSASPGIGR